MPTSQPRELTLRDRLSRLTYTQACKLLGGQGSQLLRAGGRYEVAIPQQVRLCGDLFRLQLPDAVVTITLRSDARGRILWNCTACSIACAHVGAAFSLILEEKLELGLAAPPRVREPAESLGEEELVERALDDRAERARTERMTCRSNDSKRPWADYLVTSAESGKTYRVALRGEVRGESYCSCPDFQKNTLGTCKHILNALDKVRRRFPAAERRRKYRRERASLTLHYGEELSLRLLLPDRVDEEVERIARPFAEVKITKIDRLLHALRKLELLGHDVLIYPDAEEYIQQRLKLRRLGRVVEEIRRKPARHVLRKTLLNAELLPYQLDGIAFAAQAGRAILADDMGLGKTIQGIGLAELLAREVGIEKVLVICPASVKAQWAREIGRFSGRETQIVLGSAESRARQYDNGCFFTVCNYEQVLRDLLGIERVPWDLIVLDEAQRIKNWQAKTSAVVKSLRSPFALALTGTPLENRLDDIYSVIEFLDDRRLGPAFRFFNRHRVVDEAGKVLGYKNLAELRKSLAPVMLRRSRDTVMAQLPPRTTEIVRITPTEEQLDIHVGQSRIIQSIVNKPYISEMDLLRLQKALLICRMVANSTFLVDKQRPSYSTKLERLGELLDGLVAEKNRKIVLFSEWTTMLDEVESLLQKRGGVTHVRLDGKVPQKRRQRLVDRFQNDHDCKLFLTTNAGATGLNLQAADTVINVDLPWNPAMLEQRIGRAHRMGQKRPVQVFVLVTEDTIEENLLATLSAKQQLFLAVLDPDSKLDEVQLQSGIEELKRRLEVLLGTKPVAPLDASGKLDREQESARLAQQTRISAAGGKLLTAAFEFLDEMIPAAPQADAARAGKVGDQLKQQLTNCLDRDEDGRMRLSVTLPDSTALDKLAASLARLLARGAGDPVRP